MMIMVSVYEDTVEVESWEVEITTLKELDNVMKELENDYEDSIVSYFNGEIAVRID